MIRQVAGMVAAGASVSAAARAVGILPARLDAWRQARRAGRATPQITRFLQEMDKAKGLAKAQAQVRTLKDKPLDWLKNHLGPKTTGRSANNRWSRTDELAIQLHQYMGLLNSLEQWPEARMAAATWARDLTNPHEDLT